MRTSVGTSQKQRMCEGESNDESEDRITHLPDNILHYILSLLTTKNAVGTSVLSTRWRYLWTSIYNFDFCDSEVYTGYKSKNYSKRKMLFRDFVDRVLLLTDVADINKFSLECDKHVCDGDYFNTWISIVTRRKVEELAIYFKYNTPGVYLNWIFSCEPLRILKIKMLETIELPASVCFSSLKILHLEDIDFSSDPEVQVISLSFPILEELVISHCEWPKIKTVNIVVPTLRSLTIDDRNHYVLFDCEIKIKAKRLVSLKFRSDFLYNYSLCHLSSLVDASIDIAISCHSETILVGSFLREISNATYLEVSGSSIKTLVDPSVSADVHSLSRLIHLRVAENSLVSCKTLINLLCILPKLESLVFPCGPDSFIFNGQILGTTPQCYLSHLKLVDVGSFRGIDTEIWFVKFWIKSVTSKGDLTIKLGSCSGKSAGWKKQINRKLDLARYPNCVLDFC